MSAYIYHLSGNQHISSEGNFRATVVKKDQFDVETRIFEFVSAVLPNYINVSCFFCVKEVLKRGPKTHFAIVLMTRHYA